MLLERMQTEGLADVFQTVKNLRIQRPAMVQTLVGWLASRVGCLVYVCQAAVCPPCRSSTSSPMMRQWTTWTLPQSCCLSSPVCVARAPMPASSAGRDEAAPLLPSAANLSTPKAPLETWRWAMGARRCMEGVRPPARLVRPSRAPPGARC